MFQTKRELAWLQSLRFGCPDCGETLRLTVHKRMKARPRIDCPNGHKTGLVRYLDRRLKERYVHHGGADGSWGWR
jgi:predicted RNA-binding Zn-ribbon protein involved in translation (DUF1610 family)